MVVRKNTPLLHQINNPFEDHSLQCTREARSYRDRTERVRRGGRLTRLKKRQNTRELPKARKDARGPRKIKDVKKTRLTRERKISKKRIRETRRINCGFR